MLFRPDTAETFKLSPIKQIELAAAKIPGSISLAQGIPSFQTPDVIRNFVKEKIDQGLCDKYSLTTGLAELREEISMALLNEGLKYNPDSEIVVTAGSIEGITASVLSCTEPGDEVLLPSPTYASYLGAIRLARCTPSYVELDEDHNFDFHVQKIADSITRRTKAILYCSPNNPTGTLFSENKTRAMIEIARKHNLTVIVDEVYKDFYYTNDKHFSPTEIPDAREHVIRVCSFSKAFAMTGWRVGFVHSDESRIKTLLKYHDAMVTCAPVVSQYGAIAALRFGAPFLEQFKLQFKQRRDLTIKVLDDLSQLLDYQVPKAAYFAFPRIKDSVPLAHDSHKLAYDILEKAKVALVPGIAFGPSGESHLRITFGREQRDLEEGLSRFAEYLSGARKSYRTRVASDSQHRETSWRRTITKTVLGYGARAYLARTKPLVIGITGTTGKTVVKRLVSELLGRHKPTRANILSYNTDIGLPLSILNLKAPKSRSEKLYFPIHFLHRVIIEREESEQLVLEYGVQSADDASALLSIAKPDWLLIGDTGTSDPSFDVQEIRQGIKKLIDALPRDRVIWDGTDSWLAGSELGLDRALCADVQVAQFSREIAGDSARFGLLGATILGQKLGIPAPIVASFLNS